MGQVAADLTVDATGPERRVTGAVSTAHLNVAPLVRRADVKSDISGDARIDLALPSAGRPIRGTYTVKANRVQIVGYDARNVDASGRIDGRVIHVKGSADAYGGRATTEGVVVAGRPLSLDLKGRAASVDLRNLPPVANAPGVPSDLQFAYTLTGRNARYSGDVTMDASTLAGASIAPGTTGQFSFGAGLAPTYAAQGQVTNLDVEQVGRGFAIRALASERYRSRITATYTINGSGGGRYPLTIDATGTAVDSEIFGASFPRMDFTTHIGGGDLHVKALGQFDGLDPAVVTGSERVAGKLTGAVDVVTTFRDFTAGLTVDSFDATGRLNLGRSTFADLAIDTAIIDGTYANREGHLTQVSIAGPEIKVAAQGDIALNETGASNLTAHLESPALERIAEVIGHPLKGAAIIDATVTGNASELKAAGTLQGSNIGYGDNEALTLKSSFDVAVPELMPAKATVKAKSTATFLEVAGQQVRELTAETTYSQSKLDFNAVAQEGVRQLAAQGSATFHPDHQEIHLGDAGASRRTDRMAHRSRLAARDSLWRQQDWDREPPARQRRSAHRGGGGDRVAGRSAARAHQQRRCRAARSIAARRSAARRAAECHRRRLGTDEAAARRRRVHAVPGRLPAVHVRVAGRQTRLQRHGDEPGCAAAADAASVAHGHRLRATVALPPEPGCRGRTRAARTR